MKKIILLLVAVLLFGLSWTTHAKEEFTSGDYEYILLDDGTAEITHYNTGHSISRLIGWYDIWYEADPEDLIVPEMINSYVVTSIGEYAFEDCENLNSIQLPESITSIGDRAFYDCESLSSIQLPESVTSIGDSAFYYCVSLNSIQLPENLTNIGNAAFYHCDSLISIKLPERLTSIGDEVFYHCTSLSSITLPEGLTSIGNSVFKYCKSLSKIILPEGLKSIGKEAFFHCASLRSIQLPESVTSMGKRAFFDCSNLTITVTRDSYAKNYCVENGLNYIYTEVESPIFQYILLDDGTAEISEYKGSEVDLTVPDTIDSCAVTSIGNDAFKGCVNLNSITLPEGLTSIGDNAFKNCANLSIINLPDSVTEIGNNPFVGCSSLEQIIVSIDHPVLEVIDGLLYNKKGKKLVYCPIQKQQVELPEGIEKIGVRAFSGCSSLRSITLPEGVTKIGNYAFSGCKSLNSIMLPEGLTSIGKKAFSDCTSLTDINLLESVTSIGDGAFSGCSNITITVSRDSYAEGYCKENGLKYIDAEESIASDYEYVLLDDGTAEITGYKGSEADLIVPNTIDGYAVTKLGSKCFAGLGSIKSITLPDSVTSIGEKAFDYCRNLSSITLPEGLKSIGNTAFGETGLRSITLPDSITELGEIPFLRCPFLEQVTVSADHPLLEVIDGLLYNKKDKKLIFCPIQKQQVEIPQGIQIIGDFAFDECSINSITFHEGLRSIGIAAFHLCRSLSSVTLPEGVTSIGDYAFGYCTSLSSITLPEGITSIGEYAFFECVSLTGINLPESLTSIGDRVFMACRNLTITVTRDSYAEKYCEENGLNYIYAEEEEPIASDYEDILQDDGTAEITDFKGSEADLTVPEIIYVPGSYSGKAQGFRTVEVTVTVDENEITAIKIDGHEETPEIGGAAINQLADQILEAQSAQIDGVSGATVTSDAVSNALTQALEKAMREDSQEAGTPTLKPTATPTPEPIPTTEYEVSQSSIEYVLQDDGTAEITDFKGDKADLTVPEMIYVPGSYSGKAQGIGGVVEVTVTVDENEITAIKIDGHEETPDIGGAALNQLADQILEAQSAQIDGVSGATLTSTAVSNALTQALEKAMREDSREAGTPTLKPTATPTPEPIPTTEDEVSQSSIEYVLLDDGTAEITDYKGDEADLIVPDKIDGYVVTSIGNNAFSYCDSLISITLPESVTNIGEDAFNSCRNLRNITLPEGLISIGRWAFFCCESLTSLTLPDSVTEIGGNPFGGCISLEQVDVSGKHPVLAVIEGLLYYKPEKRLVYCPLQKQHVEIPKGIQIIGDWAFVNCTNLSSITLPESLLTIGDGVFFNCTSLNSINFPESVTSIGDWAFYDSSDLTITVSRDSYAEKYCEENEMDYVYTDSLDWLE